MMNITTLPENNIRINPKLFLLDPLSVIIKLAILGNKSIGTKIVIQNNIIYFQEPGMFQAICRYVLNTNKTDLQYMYNPIQIACETFLSKDIVKKTPRIKNLFICAQTGIKKLIETYENCSIINLCLHYYYAIISNYIDENNTNNLFYSDHMTSLYTKEVIEKLNNQWSDEKIKVILDLITFLTKDTMAANNVKSIENIMEYIDSITQSLLKN